MLKRFVAITALSLLFGLASCSGKKIETPEEENYVEQPEYESIGDKNGHSVAPVLGYEPTYKFVAGAAYFFQSPTVNFGIDANWNFRDVYQAHLNLNHRFMKFWNYELYSGFIKGFDPFYGEGGETKVANYTQIWSTRNFHRFQITRKLSKTFSVGAVAHLRGRSEDLRGLPRKFGDETTGAAGLIVKFDSRDDENNPREGWLFSLEGYGSPRGFTTEDASFSQFEGTLVLYKGILEEISSQIIAAYRLMGGYTLGDPTYMYTFRLGGSDYLVGYLENRFRGKYYYLQQTEVRFPIWKLFSGATFLSFGDATNESFTNPKMSYGAGIRIGLPPDFVSRVRIDFGVGRDQSGFFADFGQTF